MNTAQALDPDVRRARQQRKAQRRAIQALQSLEHHPDRMVALRLRNLILKGGHDVQAFTRELNRAFARSK
jgi:hypothetical protein